MNEVIRFPVAFACARDVDDRRCSRGTETISDRLQLLRRTSENKAILLLMCLILRILYCRGPLCPNCPARNTSVNYPRMPFSKAFV